MKTPEYYTAKYQPETIACANKIEEGSVSQQSHAIGMLKGEPIIVAMDAMLRYVKAYEKRFDEKISTDYVFSGHVKDVIDGLAELLNGDGAVAWEMGRTTDSKDNVALYKMRDAVYEAAGFEKL